MYVYLCICLINEVDADGNGTIDFPEVLCLMARTAKNMSAERELIEACKVYDEENTGFMNIDALWMVLSDLGERLTESEVLELAEESFESGVLFLRGGGELSSDFICEQVAASFKEWLATGTSARAAAVFAKEPKEIQLPKSATDPASSGRSAEEAPSLIGVKVLALSGSELVAIRIDAALTVREMKKRIQPFVDVSAPTENLVFCGATLKETDSLAGAGLLDGSEITLIRRAQVMLDYGLFAQMVQVRDVYRCPRTPPVARLEMDST